MSKTYDSIVIGAGQAGPPLAEQLSQAGESVAIIERDRVGGTCVNYGCIPTKALVASARRSYGAAWRRFWRGDRGRGWGRHAHGTRTDEAHLGGVQ